MSETSFMTVDEVAEALRVSKSYAYKIIRQLNAELKKEGYIVISGRINKHYFIEKTCYKPTSKERSN
ncbi:MAG: helix-turn-helix domain-containing protein [Clostridia bacterium]|nr:helix-turn-helix domain-containing protein [Clostridia bacterium]